MSLPDLTNKTRWRSRLPLLSTTRKWTGPSSIPCPPPPLGPQVINLPPKTFPHEGSPLEVSQVFLALAQGLFPDQDRPLEAQLTLVRPSRVARASHFSRRLAISINAHVRARELPYMDISVQRRGCEWAPPYILERQRDAYAPLATPRSKQSFFATARSRALLCSMWCHPGSRDLGSPRSKQS